MKKLLFVLVLFHFFTTQAQHLRAASGSADISFLDIGNSWTYRIFYPPNTENSYTMEIIADTVMPDGYTYYVIKEYIPLFYSQIIRSDSEAVYLYNTLEERSVQVFNFNDEPGTSHYGAFFYYSNVSFNGVLTQILFDEETTVLGYSFGGIVFANAFISPEFGFIQFEDYGDNPSAIPGTTYQLQSCVINGISYSTVGVKEISVGPQNFELLQNYPNPFNPSTTIKFRIDENKFVTLKVFDLLGNEVTTLLSEDKLPGEYTFKFDASNLSTGAYYYTLNADGVTFTKKMIVLK